MKRIVLLVLLLILSITIQAVETRGVVLGKVIDTRNKEALEFVNVSIRKQGTDTLLKGTVTDEAGNFVLDGLGEGYYTLTYSFGNMNKNNGNKQNLQFDGRGAGSSLYDSESIDN